MLDDPLKRHFTDYAAFGSEHAIPPMPGEVHSHGSRIRRRRAAVTAALGVAVLAATFLAGMTVNDHINATAAADVTTPTVPGSSAPTTTLLGAQQPGALATVAPVGPLTPSTTATPGGLGNLFQPVAPGQTLPVTPSTVGGPTVSTLGPYGGNLGGGFNQSGSGLSGGYWSSTTAPRSNQSVPTTAPPTTRPPVGGTTAPPLANGVHPVILRSVSGRQVVVDKVQFFEGAEATREARADGRTATKGWYVRNANAATRTLPVATGAALAASNRTMGIAADQSKVAPVALDKLAQRVPTGQTTVFSITVQGGKIVELRERFLPA